MSLGQLSVDGNLYWNGQAWVPAVSPDGLWRWNGQSWMPSAPLAVAGALLPVPASGAMVVAPKSPAVSLIVSFFIPGVGSLINGDTGIGLTILLLWLLAIALDITVVGAIVGIPLGIAMFIWGLVDAYQSARRWNARHGIIS